MSALISAAARRLRAELLTSAGAAAVGSLQAGAGAVARTLQSKARDFVSVKDFGAVGDGVTNDAAAFNAAWAAIKPTGGRIYVPRGSYLLNAEWLMDVSLLLPFNYEVIGYGAELLAGPAVVGHAVRVSRGFNNFGVTIEGLHFNHRGNATVSGCIKAEGAANLKVLRCSQESHGTKEGYDAIWLGPYTAGDPDTNSFWSLIDGFTTRARSGGDGTPAEVGIALVGNPNATKIRNCSFGGVVDSIQLRTDGTGNFLCNAVLIEGNDFEQVTNAVSVVTTGAASMPTGLRIQRNRVESATTFVRIAGAAAVADASYPPILSDNYLTVGSVTNYLQNANNQLVFTSEPSYFGMAAPENKVGGPVPYRVICEGAGNNLVVSKLSGVSDYVSGHLQLGVYHLWVESATGKLRINAGAPAADNDGTVVGAQTA